MSFEWDLGRQAAAPAQATPTRGDESDTVEERYGVGQLMTDFKDNGPSIGGRRNRDMPELEEGHFVVMLAEGEDDWSFEVCGKHLWLAQIKSVKSEKDAIMATCLWYTKTKKASAAKFTRSQTVHEMELTVENLVVTFPSLNTNGHLPKNVVKRMEHTLQAGEDAMQNAAVCCAHCKEELGEEEEDEPFVMCEVCYKWFHYMCTDTPKEAGRPWWCKACAESAGAGALATAARDGSQSSVEQPI